MVTSLSTFSAGSAPVSYPVRLYPDVTHSISDQLPIPMWDPAFQWTENREVVNPRPISEAAIAASQKPWATAGVSTYNEGCHDDINKHVWLAVFWGCDEVAGSSAGNCDHVPLVRQWLEHYARLHFGSALQEAGASCTQSSRIIGILASARNEVSCLLRPHLKVLPHRMS
jgi:hypothetical protein|eukprot:COSAG01_NODE_3123_length_6553_cov_9.997676_1_plen_170_part_10